MRLILLIFAVLICGSSVQAAGLPADSSAQQVLNRLAFGPRPGDLERVSAMGVDRYIQQQLHPESIPLPAELSSRLGALETLDKSPVALFLKYGPPRGFKKDDPDAKAEFKDLLKQSRVVVRQAIEARLVRAVESPRQLQEVMTDFWFNHFNVFAGKGLDRLWVEAYERDAIRPHALGSFRELLEATAKHPAMLFYLDNWQNTAADAPGAHGRFNGLNENYARELLELHTLGVDSGYTQKDVTELARILTGWGLRRRGDHHGFDGSGFFFDKSRHDFGDKVLLGHQIRGRGSDEVEEALDILAAHPATAHHICFQLAQYFVNDDPDPALVNMLIDEFNATHGDIRAVLSKLFASPQFRDPKNIGNKFKTPYQYAVSSIRATGLPLDNVLPIAGAMAVWGQPLYGCQTPDGYKNTQRAWLNPDAMSQRLNFAAALGAGRLAIDTPPSAGDEEFNPKKLDNLKDSRFLKPSELAVALDAHELERTLGTLLKPKTLQTVATAPTPLQAGLILGSPEFMYR